MSEGRRSKGKDVVQDNLEQGRPDGRPYSSAEEPIAEVISSSITGFQAECMPNKERPDLPAKPSFGSFLKVGSEKHSIFAVVYNVITGPQDSVHKPSALGMTREELRMEQPHIFSLLKTEVHAQLIGFGNDGEVFQHLPPQPPDVHDFVFKATPNEIRQLTRNFEFLRLLANVSEIPSDELIAATIREAHRALGSNRSFLIEAGRAVSNILRSDYDRLLTILKKIKPETG